MKFGSFDKNQFNIIQEKRNTEKTAGSAAVRISGDIRQGISGEIMRRLDPDRVSQLDGKELRNFLSGLVKEICDEKNYTLNAAEHDAMISEIAADMRGIGPLEQLLQDKTITDIMVNGPDRIYIDRAGQRVLTDLSFRSTDHLNAVAQRIARWVGRRVDEKNPLVDARLKDGSRVNIVFPPIALDGTSISIRKFPERRLMFEDLIRNQALTPAMSEFLKVAAEARCNIVVSGGTGSGKTTLMTAIGQHISPQDRVVTIEDAAELQLPGHIVRMETRAAMGEDGIAVTQRDLVRNALRMNPDRVIIGECRQGEAFDMLQAMNTGHDGSLTTLHANTPRDAVARLENMVLMAGMDLPVASIRRQIASAIDIIVQVEKMRDGRRRVTSISEILGLEGEIVSLHELFHFGVEGFKDGRLLGSHKMTTSQPRRIEKFQHFGIEDKVKQIFMRGRT